MENEIDYPYQSISKRSTPSVNHKGECRKGFKSIIQVTSFTQVKGPLSFDQMKVMLIEHGPFIGLIHSNDQMRDYRSGILHLNCTKDVSYNHAIIVVGFGEEKGEQYIIIRNSWGNSWGEKGYARIAFSNLCGLNGDGSSSSPSMIYLSTIRLFSFFSNSSIFFFKNSFYSSTNFPWKQNQNIHQTSKNEIKIENWFEQN